MQAILLLKQWKLYLLLILIWSYKQRAFQRLIDTEASITEVPRPPRSCRGAVMPAAAEGCSVSASNSQCRRKREERERARAERSMPQGSLAEWEPVGIELEADRTTSALLTTRFDRRSLQKHRVPAIQRVPRRKSQDLQIVLFMIELINKFTV